jgi:hypothetical protein
MATTNFLDTIDKIIPISSTDKKLTQYPTLKDMYNALQSVRVPAKHRKLWKLYLSFLYFSIFRDPKLEHILDLLYIFSTADAELVKHYFVDYLENYQQKKTKDTIFLDKKMYKIQKKNLESIFDHHTYKIEKITYFKPQGEEYIMEYFRAQGLEMSKTELAQYNNIAESYITDIEALYNSRFLIKLRKEHINSIKTLEKFMKIYIKKIEIFLKSHGLLPDSYRSKFRIRSTDKPVGLFSVEMIDSVIYMNYYEELDPKKVNLEEIINTMVHEFSHYLQYLGSADIDSALTPGYIFEGYAHYLESFFIHYGFLRDQDCYPLYVSGYYKDSLMRIYRYHLCYKYNLRQITSEKIYQTLLRLYSGNRLVAENETIRILMDPYVCGYYLVKEKYLEKIGYDMATNKKILLDVAKQRRIILGF